MLGYWLAVVRRLALPAATVGLLIAGAMAAVMVLGDGAAAGGALAQSAGSGAVVAALFAALLATQAAVGAARTAGHYGLALDADAVAVPCDVEIRLPHIPGRTAFQLTDSVRHAIARAPMLRVEQTGEFGHGTLDLELRAPSGLRVTAAIRITTGPDATTATISTRPAAAHRRLDGGASWGTARVLERCAREALRAEAHPAPH
ncbi:hypothetical protein ACWGDE_02345 [Streptomyces sp. NPDC054956]